jgi:DNA-binding response OmpR family regulator
MSAEPLINLLIVEDDERLAALTSEYLVKHAIAVTHVLDGESGFEQARKIRFDIILLDIMLPGESGIKICQKLRRLSDVPIIMITARGEEADRVLGLEIGADDYLAKPFSPRELLARIRAVVRRARGQAGPKTEEVTVGRLVLDPGKHIAVLAGRKMDLTGYEFSLLYALASRAGRVLGREQLMEQAKGNAEESFDRSIDVHISRLRQKLGDDPRKPKLIKTVRGVGYQYMTGDES